jgi:DNA-binding MurR/RpiR family transcriptional regulator
MKTRDTAALFAGAVDEIRGVLEAGAAGEVDRLCDELLKAHRIACYGVGREGPGRSRR